MIFPLLRSTENFGFPWRVSRTFGDSAVARSYEPLGGLAGEGSVRLMDSLFLCVVIWGLLFGILGTTANIMGFLLEALLLVSYLLLYYSVRR